MSSLPNINLERYTFNQSLTPSDQILAQQNLLISGLEDFGSNKFSNLLVNASFARAGIKLSPKVIISIVPLKPNSSLFNLHSSTAQTWIEQNNNKLDPLRGSNLIWEHEERIFQNGILYPKTYGNDENNDEFRYYFEFLANGYIEYGLSSDVTYSNEQGQKVLSLRNTIGRTWMLIGFAQNYYKKFDYNDGFLVVVSLVGVKDFALGGFGGKTSTATWAEPYSWDYEHPPTNKYEDDVQIRRGILTDTKIEDVVHDIAEEISHAFGEINVKCYNDDGTLAEGFRL